METTVLSTERLATRDRLAFWRSVIDDHYVKVDLDLPRRSGFRGEVRHRQLGPLAMTRYRASPNSAERTRRHIARDGCDDVFCFLPLTGEMIFEQAGRKALAQPGTLCLLHGGRPFTLAQPADVDVRVTRLPSGLLEARLPDLGWATCRAVRTTTSMPGLAAAFLEKASREASSVPDVPGLPATLARQAADLVAFSFLVEPDDGLPHDSAVKAALYRRAVDHIDTHLQNPDLTPKTVAGGIGISQRYLQAVFAARGHTPSAFIRQRRVKAARQVLENPAFLALSIAQIAYAHGFACPAHFSRVFKQHCGASPKSIRAALH